MLYSYLSREGKFMSRAKTVRRISGNMQDRDWCFGEEYLR